jgi:hypothetical protein
MGFSGVQSGLSVSLFGDWADKKVRFFDGKNVDESWWKCGGSWLFRGRFRLYERINQHKRVCEEWLAQ